MEVLDKIITHHFVYPAYLLHTHGVMVDVNICLYRWDKMQSSLGESNEKVRVGYNKLLLLESLLRQLYYLSESNDYCFLEK